MNAQIPTYYRPEWTCGRYNADAHVAIFYNLIEGLSYLFEDFSADVVGCLLAVKRNGVVSVEHVAKETNIAVESLTSFFEQLHSVNLLTTSCPQAENIAQYRSAVSAHRCSVRQNEERTIAEKLPMAVSTVEMEYMEKAKGVGSVMFELTYNCSEKCIHCYNMGATRNNEEESFRADREELQLEDYKRIIDQLYDKGLFKVCLSGGDPFSKPIAWDIIEYLYEKGIAFDVFTNGQRLVNDVERLAGYYPRLVGVSIYSGIAKDHDFITRIPNSWKKSMEVVAELSRLAVPLNLKCCVMRSNVKSYYLVSDIARKYGAEAQFELNVSDSVDGDKCVSKYLRLTPDLLDIVLRDSNTSMYVGKEAPNFGGQSRRMDVNGCGAGDNSFCITPEGYLIPCCSFHKVFGDLKVQSVDEILTDNVVLKQWQNLTLNEYEECGKYDYCAYCNLCPGLNFSEHHDERKAAENNCYMAKCRYDLAQRMMRGEDSLHGKSVAERLSELSDYQVIHIQREK